MSEKCELFNEDLLKDTRWWIDILCRSGGERQGLFVPSDTLKHLDSIVSELCRRFEELLQPTTGPGEEDGPWAEGLAERCGNVAICDHTQSTATRSYLVCLSCGAIKNREGGEWGLQLTLVKGFAERCGDALPGGSTPSQYALPKGAAELQDLIEFREMNFAMGNIFKACYRKKDAVDRLYDIRKIIWFAQREEQRLIKEE